MFSKYATWSVAEWIEPSASETVDSSSILGQVKPKTRKIGINNFPAWRSAIKKDSVKSSLCVVDRWQLDFETTKVSLLSPDQGN